MCASLPLYWNLYTPIRSSTSFLPYLALFKPYLYTSFSLGVLSSIMGLCSCSLMSYNVCFYLLPLISAPWVYSDLSVLGKVLHR